MMESDFAVISLSAATRICSSSCSLSAISSCGGSSVLSMMAWRTVSAALFPEASDRNIGFGFCTHHLLQIGQRCRFRVCPS